MTVTAGARILAEDARAPRIATTVVTTSSSATSGTTELQVTSVAASLILGKTYRVRYAGAFTASVTTDHHFIRIREDTSAGDQMQGRRLTGPTAASAYPVNIEAEYTADATGSKTFVVTLQRTAGSGTITNYAAGDQPGYLAVDYVSG
jgi:hypothetical protein